MTEPVPDVQAILAGRPALLQDACRRALAYLGGLAERPVAPAAEAVAALGRLDFALPGPGLDAAEVLRMLDEIGSPATVASAGPRYFGFVTGGTLPAAQAAAWLAGAWGQNAALTVMSPAAALLTAVALRWVAGAPPVTVVVGAEVHAAVRKALGLVGLGRDRATVLPVDGQGRIDPAVLPAL